MDNYKQVADQFPGQAVFDQPFSQLTTLGIGGNIRLVVTANSQQEVLKAVSLAQENNLNFLVLGSGSNLLVTDKPLELLVIKNAATGIKQDGDQLIVEAGTVLQELVDYTLENGLAGMQRMTGIPGTVGGAIYGNAGAYGQTIAEFLTEVQVFTGQNTLTLSKEDCQFEYRDSGFKKNKFIILSATFKLPSGDPSALKQEAEETLELRKKKYHPGIKCPGSFFRNYLTSEIPEETLAMLPPRIDTFGKTPAYIFLEELGAKGDQQGQIKIADYHANLFMNLGGGTAEDFYQLASKWHKKVKEKYGIDLEPEVQLIGLSPLNKESY